MLAAWPGLPWAAAVAKRREDATFAAAWRAAQKHVEEPEAPRGWLPQQVSKATRSGKRMVRTAWFLTTNEFCAEFGLPPSALKLKEVDETCEDGRGTMRGVYLQIAPTDAPYQWRRIEFYHETEYAVGEELLNPAQALRAEQAQDAFEHGCENCQAAGPGGSEPPARPPPDANSPLARLLPALKGFAKGGPRRTSAPAMPFCPRRPCRPTARLSCTAAPR